MAYNGLYEGLSCPSHCTLGLRYPLDHPVPCTLSHMPACDEQEVSGHCYAHRTPSAGALPHLLLQATVVEGSFCKAGRGPPRQFEVQALAARPSYAQPATL